MVRDVSLERDPHYFEEESFVCVCAETALDAASGEDFVDRAAAFVNDRLWGNLALASWCIRSFAPRRETRIDSRI